MVDLLPVVEDLLLYPPATCRKRWLWEKDGVVVDLSSWTAKLQVREKHGTAALLTLTNGSGITLASTGHITVVVTGAQGAALEDATSRPMSYDLYLEPSAGDSVRFAMGRVVISPSITVDS